MDVRGETGQRMEEARGILVEIFSGGFADRWMDVGRQPKMAGEAIGMFSCSAVHLEIHHVFQDVCGGGFYFRVSSLHHHLRSKTLHCYTVALAERVRPERSPNSASVHSMVGIYYIIHQPILSYFLLSSAASG